MELNKIIDPSIQSSSLKPSFYKEFNMAKIAFYESPGTDVTVLMIHGNASNASNYKKQIHSFLGNKYHIVAFDFPGCGNSSKSDMPEQTYGLIPQAELLAKIIRSIDEKCWLVGNSIGCNIALYAAQKNPKNIRGFILSGGILVDSVSASPEAVLQNPDLPIIFQMDITDPEWYRLAKACLFNKDSELVDKIVHDFKMTDPLSRFLLSSSVADPEFYFGHRRFLTQTNLPVAIVEGKNDLFINYRYLENLLIPTIWKNKIQFVENAAHYPHQENPADTNSLIDEIISSFK